MNVRPLIVRELRAEARRAGSYWVRSVAAGILTAVFVWSVWNFAGNPNTLGKDLFGALSEGMVLGVLIIVSALTSDSISREKREGTLGLLFLTPLNAREIVIGKALLHGLRALVIFLAMAPIVGLPFLLGGIPLKEVIENFLTLGIAFFVAINSGIIASVYNTHWIQAMVWGVILAGAQAAGFLFAFISLVLGGTGILTHTGWLRTLMIIFQLWLAISFGVAAAFGRWRGRAALLRVMIMAFACVPFLSMAFLLRLPLERWTFFFVFAPVLVCFVLMGKRGARIYQGRWFQWMVWGEIILGGQFLATVLCEGIVRRLSSEDSLYLGAFLIVGTVQLWFVAAFGGMILKQRWDEESETEKEPSWARFFSASAFWRGVFRWDTRRARDRNPIAWLQEYNWTSRLTKWGWCVLLFAAEMRMLLHFRAYIDYQMQLYYLTAMGIAFSAAASFRRERQTGALELLLVTPVSARHLIFGRLQGVWVHFLPAMAILGTVWAMGPQWISLPIRFMFYLAGAYFCIPVIGFYCSMLTANVLVSWLLTLFFGLLLPYAGTEAFRWEIGRRNLPVAFFAVQLVFGVIAAGLLYENLARRRFALQKT